MASSVQVDLARFIFKTRAALFEWLEERWPKYKLTGFKEQP